MSQRRYLILSGIAFGLALLSKSYALVLLPWIPLCLLLFREKQNRRLGRYLTEGICFLNCAVLTVLTLWPVFWTPLFALMALCLLGLTFLLLRDLKAERSPMWLVGLAFTGLTVVGVRAIQNVWLVLDKVGWALTTPHEIDHFLLGKIIADPGWIFYPIVLSIKSSPFVLPLAIFAILFFLKHRKLSGFLRFFKLTMALGLVAILFTLCLSLTAKKFPRYLLPAFPMLDILAGIGLFYTVKWIGTALKRTTAPRLKSQHTQTPDTLTDFQKPPFYRTIVDNNLFRPLFSKAKQKVTIWRFPQACQISTFPQLKSLSQP